MEDTNNKLSLRDNLLIKILVPFCYGLGDFLSKTNFYPIRNEISDKLDKIVPYFNLDKDHEEKVMAGKKELLFYQRLKNWSHLLYHISKIKPRRFAGVRSPFVVRDKSREELWELNKKYLDDMRATCLKHGISLVMFVWPNVNPTVLYNWFIMDKLKEYCVEYGIATFDARTMTSNYDPNELILEHDAHPNALANRLMAKAAWMCLKGNGMV